MRIGDVVKRLLEDLNAVGEAQNRGDHGEDTSQEDRCDLDLAAGGQVQGRDAVEWKNEDVEIDDNADCGDPDGSSDHDVHHTTTGKMLQPGFAGSWRSRDEGKDEGNKVEDDGESETSIDGSSEAL